MMDLANIALAVALIAVVVTVAKPIFDVNKSNALNRKFVSIGNLIGKSYNEISSIVGEPSIKESAPDGTVYTWDSPKYAIRLKFNQENICISKLGEVSKK